MSRAAEVVETVRVYWSRLKIGYVYSGKDAMLDTAVLERTIRHFLEADLLAIWKGT